MEKAGILKKIVGGTIALALAASAGVLIPLYALGDTGSLSVYSSTADGYAYETDATYATAQADTTADAIDTSGNTMRLGQRAAGAYSDTYYGSTSDGYTYKSDSNYTNARLATSGDGASDSPSWAQIGQWYSAGNYSIYRIALYFDTSGLPDDATITAATLNVYGNLDNSTTDFNIQVQNGQPTYPHDPLEAGDYNQANYSSNGGYLSTASFSVGAYNTITLNSTGWSWISLTSTTKLCLRSSRDINGNFPTGYEYVRINTAEYYLTDHDPYLDITYTTPDSSLERIDRVYLYFDTSSLPDSATIDSATLKIYGEEDNSTTDFNIQVQSGQPTYPHNPLEVGDYDKSQYSGNGGSLSTSGFSVSSYNEITLNSTGRSWISLTGTTKLCLRSDEDINASAPTGDEYVSIYASDYTGTSYDPQLVIYYTAPAFVLTLDATNVSTTTATLQGELTSMEGEDYVSVYFEYGTTDSYGTTTEEQSVVTIGTFNQGITGLRYDVTYHFRAAARIGDVTYYGDDNTFMTLYAAGSSTDLLIVSAAVFSDYKESGDLLFCVETINTYSGYYPSMSAERYFQVQLLDTDGSTILGAVPLSNWGDRPTAIYKNATDAASLTEGSAYFMRMIGVLITDNPYVDYQLTDEDWYGYDLEALDEWCIGVAANMQVSDGRSDYLTNLTGVGVVIDDPAGAYFTSGIAGINIVRPNLFTTTTVIPEWSGGTDESSWDSASEWETNVGSNIATDAAVLGTPFGLGGKDTLAGAVALTVVCLMLIGGGVGALGAAVITVPVIWVNTYFKIVPVQIIVLICMLFGGLAIRQFVIKTL